MFLDDEVHLMFPLFGTESVFSFFRGGRSVPLLHGPFKSICRSGANPEKTLRIRGGAMQVYHHNQ